MPGPASIEGYAIVSADGMLADANRHIPDAMVVKADQDFFQDSLDQAAVIVHGRHSHEGGGSRAAGRRRLIVTTRVAALADDSSHPHALLWNPNGAALAEAWARLAAPDGLLAVIGGPEVYELFLASGYDKFHLSQAPHVRIPGGRPVFPEVGLGRTPEDILTSHGLKPGPRRVLDAAAPVTLTTWMR
jgi:dihydrofolate reductase